MAGVPIADELSIGQQKRPTSAFVPSSGPLATSVAVWRTDQDVVVLQVVWLQLARLQPHVPVSPRSSRSPHSARPSSSATGLPRANRRTRTQPHRGEYSPSSLPRNTRNALNTRKGQRPFFRFACSVESVQSVHSVANADDAASANVSWRIPRPTNEDSASTGRNVQSERGGVPTDPFVEGEHEQVAERVS